MAAQSAVVARKPSSFTYKSGSASLDLPHMATSPMLLSGYVLASHAFIMVWNNPSAGTSGAIVNGSIIPLTFLAHDGSVVTTNVKVTSVTVGSLLIATLTVMTPQKVTL